MSGSPVYTESRHRLDRCIAEQFDLISGPPGWLVVTQLDKIGCAACEFVGNRDNLRCAGVRQCFNGKLRAVDELLDKDIILAGLAQGA